MEEIHYLSFQNMRFQAETSDVYHRKPAKLLQTKLNFGDF